MTVQQLWAQDAEYQASDDRLLLAALLPNGPAGPIGSAVGLRTAASLMLTMTGGFTGTVSRGAAFINFGPGIYLLTNDDILPVTFGPADPTNARIDILVAQVYDVEVGGPAQAPNIRVIPGATSATPVAPATPAGALLLNTLRYNAGATAPINTRNGATFVPTLPPTVQRFTGVFNGITLPATGGILGMTSQIVVAAVNYPRVVQLRMHFLISALPSGYAQGAIRNNASVNVATNRVTVNNNTGQIVTDILLPANTAESFGGVMEGQSAVSVGPNATNSQFSALAWPL